MAGALTVEELQAARDDLVRQLSKGVLSVTDANGERVEFATLSAMQRAISTLEQRIAAMQSGGAVNTFKFSYCKKD